ncbi:hypothetical protein [Arsukibacterium perlucidum]|uniref:hypothetical protein n=1 Tax=Arsukibacterium perlucidum TaxID=368811 RepID=UPI00039E51B8|nr:hypothetical protein [Arsukibacterium perlucidum]
MKICKLSAAALITLFTYSSHTYANAPSFGGATGGGEEVNCREEITSVPIYAGTASCRGYYLKKTCSPGTPSVTLLVEQLYKNLTKDFSKSYQPNVTVTGSITIPQSEPESSTTCSPVRNVTIPLQCTASLDFSHNEDTVTRVCDRKPVASFSVARVVDRVEGNITYYKASEGYVQFSHSDPDGTVVSAQAKINGQPASINGSTLYADFSGHEIELKVTDNDGYVTTISSVVVIGNAAICTRNGRLMKCPTW